MDEQETIEVAQETAMSAFAQLIVDLRKEAGDNIFTQSRVELQESIILLQAVMLGISPSVLRARVSELEKQQHPNGWRKLFR